MRAIYVLEGEERVGPMTADEVKHAVAEGRFTLENLGWVEGAEDWVALSDLLQTGSAEEDEPVVVAEGPGYVVTSDALRIGDEVLPLGAVQSAGVEVEHTRRGKFIVGAVIFGLLVVIALAMPHKPSTPVQWTVWGVSLAIFLLLFVRFLLAAFRPSASFLAVHLTNGDDRILPMSEREGKAAARAIEEAVAALPREEEGSAGEAEAADGS